MWVEEFKINNIKCFEDAKIKLTRDGRHYQWVTFLGENGGGKSTTLQALALLLAGPESVASLLPRPIGWVRDERITGGIGTAIHMGPNDLGYDIPRRSLKFSYHLTGHKPLSIGSRRYSEPAVVENSSVVLHWLRANAFAASGHGWFAAGYGAFRRLIRTGHNGVPSRDSPERYRNFSSMFDENDPLTSFDNWMVFLDYRISKNGDKQAKHQRDIGVAAINQLLPPGVRFDRVTDDARVQFDVNGTKVATIFLSDGYRSVIALAGDLVWRLINAFPNSSNPLIEDGVVLIDELDIHLHPTWQRRIAGVLREQFPGIQFIVATHGPFVAAGAGENALTLKFTVHEGIATVSEVKNIAAMSVDDILEGPAFGVISTYSPETQTRLDRFDILVQKHNTRSPDEEKEYQSLIEFVAEARPYGGPPEPGSLEDRIEKYLEQALP